MDEIISVTKDNYHKIVVIQCSKVLHYFFTAVIQIKR